MKTAFDGRIQNGKEEWLTPPELISALGTFDLDPCAPVERPWPTARLHFTEIDNGLAQFWKGRVWLNPPYGSKTLAWMVKMREHNHGTALIFARTETRVFFDCVWPRASALLFLRGRISFFNVDGTKSSYSGGAPSVLVAYGTVDAELLRLSGIDGKFIALAERTI